MWWNFMMGDVLGNFSRSMWAMTKYTEKGCGDLEGQLAIFEVVASNCLRPKTGQGVTDGIRANPWPWAALVNRRALSSHLVGQRYWDGLPVKRICKSAG